MKNVQRSTGNFQRSSEKNNNLDVETSLLNVETFSTSNRVNPHCGFTLLEVLVSITIISFLCGLIIGFARLANHTALRQQARAELAHWHEALERWNARFGEYPFPDDEAGEAGGVSVEVFFNFENNEPYYEELEFDRDGPGGTVPFEKRRYFNEQTGSTTNRLLRGGTGGPPLPDNFSPLLQLSIQDPWGADYRFRYLSEDQCEIWSLGPDSQPGTPGEIRLKP